MIAAFGALIGFVTVIITLVALFVGLWLDHRLHSSGIFTVILLLCSVPLSVLVMFKLSVMLVERILPNVPKEQSKDD